jgi:hypothetical protein
MNNLRPARDWEKITLFAFGAAFFAVLIAIALFDRQPFEKFLEHRCLGACESTAP